MRVAYLCSRYPAISHTFIMREILALRDAGFDVQTFTVRRVPPNELLTELDRAESARTRAILPAGPLRLLVAHLRAFLRRPAGYFRALLESLRDRPPGLRNAVWYMYYFAEAGILADELSRRGIRHVHAHFANVAANVARLAACICDGSWSLTIHGHADFGDPVTSRLRSKIASAAFTACVSDFGRAQAMLQSDPNHWPRIHRVFCGIDPERFQPPADRPREFVAPSPDHPLKLLTVGRLSPEKGHLVLLAALHDLKQRGVPVHCTFVGDGPKRSQLEAEVARHEIQSMVTFAGAIGQDRIADFYATADVFVLPSFSEGLPVVLMEAMASGLPTVSSRITGIPELIRHGEDGVLVSPARPDLLAQAIADLADDPSVRRRMAASARERIVREFDSRVTVRPLVELLRERLANREPQASVCAELSEGSAVRTTR